MKVFISWSGERSLHIAKALRSWLPTVIQVVQPFISATDIQKGDRGNETIASNLENSQFGIVCLTPENLIAPWILFESGALSKVTSASVCTYLHELTPTDVQPPLGQFQHTQANKDDTHQLLKTINRKCLQPLTDEVLDKVFQSLWSNLEEDLKLIPVHEDSEKRNPRSPDSKLDELLSLVRGIANEVVEVGTGGSSESLASMLEGYEFIQGTILPAGSFRVLRELYNYSRYRYPHPDHHVQNILVTFRNNAWIALLAGNSSNDGIVFLTEEGRNFCSGLFGKRRRLPRMSPKDKEGK